MTPGQNQDNYYYSKKCCENKAALRFLVVEKRIDLFHKWIFKGF
ncbi:MAG: hypothetical protein JWM28_1250 [Chitinophagaceae bacterium]|nr:hypothetical protein [Chitinophagaceae bacterium]